MWDLLADLVLNIVDFFYRQRKEKRKAKETDSGDTQSGRQERHK